MCHHRSHRHDRDSGGDVAQQRALQPAERGAHRAALEDLGITPHLARKGTEHGSGLGKVRWVVEQTFALLQWFRRLRIRWEIRDDIHEAFLRLGCALICWRRLHHPKS